MPGGVIRMPSRSTALTGSRPISASGKPSSGLAPVIAQRVIPRLSEFQSEYERSFRPFEKYHYQNGRWTIRRTVNDGEWLNEVQDTRRRAVENKERSRGDHFSRDHLLQIPSNATTFWEPPIVGSYLSYPSVFTERLLPHPVTGDKQNADNNRTFRRTEQIAASMRDEDTADITSRRPESASVAIQTTAILTDHSFNAAKSSQATQTAPELFERVPEVDYGYTKAADGAAVPRSLVIDPVPAGRPPAFDTTRLEILRKAKYVDAKDNSLVMPVLPRTSSMRSILTGSMERGSEFFQPAAAPCERPQSSLSNFGRRRTFSADSTNRLSDTPPENRVLEEKIPAFITANLEHPAGASLNLPAHNENLTRRLGSAPIAANADIKRGGHLLPVGAFTVSPPKRNTIRQDERPLSSSVSGMQRPNTVGDVHPRRPKQCRKPVKTMSSPILQAKNDGMSKGTFAWIDL